MSLQDRFADWAAREAALITFCDEYTDKKTLPEAPRCSVVCNNVLPCKQHPAEAAK